MNVNDLLLKRQNEKEWLNLNGYENGDPETNGEMRVIENLWKYFDLFIDAGANEGLITKKVLSLNNKAEIICFEPNPQLSEQLSNTFNLKKNVRIEGVALSSRKGNAKLFIHPNDFGTSSLFPRSEMMPSFRKVMKPITVEVTTLNNYMNIINEKRKDPGAGVFLKIDVEGGELPVLRGAMKCLRMKCPIFVQFEYSYGWQESGQKLKDAFHLLDALKFHLMRITPMGLERVRFYTSDMDNSSYCNYLAIKNVDVVNILGEGKKIATKTGFTDFYSFNSY